MKPNLIHCRSVCHVVDFKEYFILKSQQKNMLRQTASRYT
mgnify:CR=1 FL=1